MRRKDKGNYALALWLQLILALFFLMLAAIIVLTSLLVGGAVEVKGTVENAMANPERLSKFAAKVIPASIITDAIQDALPASAFRDALLSALQDPHVQSTLQGLLAAALFGNIPSKRSESDDFPELFSLGKRNEPACNGISNSTLCYKLRTTCYNLSECVRRRNTTVCQSFSRDAVSICTGL